MGKQDIYVTYLGDGAYARFHGPSVELMANSHDNPTDRVSLDLPHGLDDLVKFVEFCKYHWMRERIIQQIYPNQTKNLIPEEA